MTAIRFLSRSSKHSILTPHAGRHVIRRTQATVATGEPAVTATNRAEVTLKRFWKTVGIMTRPSVESGGEENNLIVTLDNRPLKTPSGNPLVIPNKKTLAATLVAAEWDNQDTLLKQHSLPMTSIVSRAIDAFRKSDEERHEQRLQVQEQLLKYMETDTILFHANEPKSLVLLQQTHWEPLLAWARKTYGVQLNVTSGFSIPPHSQETKEKFREVLQGMDEWEMAAMERATYTSKSFLIGLALVKKHITVEQAALASHVEVNSQIEKWGEVEDSHDVDYHDVRRQLASAACILANHRP